jgi:hypothetical protein
MGIPIVERFSIPAADASSVLATVAGITVIQNADGRIHYQCGATIDSDGANGQNGNPFAYRLDNRALGDIHGSAGYPIGGWQNIIIDEGTGHPLTEADDNCYSRTTYNWSNHPLITRYGDATAHVGSRKRIGELSIAAAMALPSRTAPPPRRRR